MTWCGSGYTSPPELESASATLTGSGLGHGRGRAGWSAVLYNDINPPNLLLGNQGLWNLGWLDTTMPSIVYIPMILVCAFVLMAGLSQSGLPGPWPTFLAGAVGSALVAGLVVWTTAKRLPNWLSSCWGGDLRVWRGARTAGPGSQRKVEVPATWSHLAAARAPTVHDPAIGGAADPIGYHRTAVRPSMPMPNTTAYTRKIHTARRRRIVSAVTNRIPGRITAP
jgi:hypothetical protein